MKVVNIEVVVKLI